MLRTSIQRASRAFSTSQVSNNLAKMTLIGNIGTDLEVRETSTGKKFVRYPIGVNGFKKDSPPSWFNIAVFNEKQIENMTQYLGKGAQIYVECDVSNTIQTHEDGSKSPNLMLFQTSYHVLKYQRAAETEEVESE